MESETNTNTTSNNYATTNWRIGGGSIVNSVTFESSISSITDDDNNNTNNKFPLILCPTSPDPPPCEITITFAQKHEVQQVYVRSTARVYEIYYASDLQNSNEYLCTVRCGIAARDEEVLHTPDTEIADLARLKEAGKDEKKLRNDSNLSTNEDGWVEVKVPDAHSGRSTQDFYEATAEINDANPCISITIRLLSLQNKGFVCVDEVYVFAEPVDSAGMENQVGQTENPSANSLMAMLVPTLLQLSKTKGVSRLQDEQTFDTREKEKSEEMGPKSTYSANVVNEIQQEPNSSVVDRHEVKLQEAVRATAKPAQLEIPPQVSNTESNPDLSCNHVERVLDRLVSRVSRIEDLFLRFEESMLKPISSIDARLQQVEQQLELLTRKSQNSGLLSCTRICAPEFSCHESEENSFYNSGFDHDNIGASGKDEADFSSAIRPDDFAGLANATQPIPSLVVTAPEFSNADDEEENHGLEPVTDCPDDKPRHVSINDALASALAGFLSSTIEPRKYTQALAVKAPDFSNEDGSNDRKDSPKAHCEVTSFPFICIDASDGTECIKDSVSICSNISSLESEGVNTSLNDENSEKPGDGVDKADEECQHHMAQEEGDSLGTSIENTVSPVSHDMEGTNSCQLKEDMENGENSNGTRNMFGLYKADMLKQVYANQTDDDFNATQEEAVVNFDCTATEEAKEGSNKDILQDVLEFSHAFSLLNFEIPILDVKFVSQENTNTKSPLEALFAGMPESNVESFSVEESVDDLATGNQCNLISVEDIELTGPATSTHFSVDANYCSVSVLPLNMDGEKLQDYDACCNQEMSTASLI